MCLPWSRPPSGCDWACPAASASCRGGPQMAAVTVPGAPGCLSPAQAATASVDRRGKRDHVCVSILVYHTLCSSVSGMFVKSTSTCFRSTLSSEVLCFMSGAYGVVQLHLCRSGMHGSGVNVSGGAIGRRRRFAGVYVSPCLMVYCTPVCQHAGAVLQGYVHDHARSNRT